MRSASAALAWSMGHPTIPQAFVGNDGIPRQVGDLECARSVMAAYSVIPIADMGTANRMWERTVGKNTSRSPLRGAPVYFYNSRAGSSGHVALATGVGDQVWTTPVWLTGSGYKGLHLDTISNLARRCGNPYSGWGTDIAGMPIDFTTSAGSGTYPYPDIDYALLRRQKVGRMFVHGTGAPTVAYEGFTDTNGAFRLRPCSENQSAIVIGGGISLLINDDRLTRLGVEAGWKNGRVPALTPTVDATVDLSGVKIPAPPAPDMKPVLAAITAEANRVIAAVPPAVIVEQKKPGN